MKEEYVWYANGVLKVLCMFLLVLFFVLCNFVTIKAETKESVSDNCITVSENRISEDGFISFYVKDDVLYIKKASKISGCPKGKIELKYEDYESTPWSLLDYKKVHIDSSIKVHLWQISKERALRYGRNRKL